MTSKNNLSIWLVVGISLLVNGILILGSGLYELAYPPANKVVLYEYHASIWWGAILAIVGAVYCYHFIPRRAAEDKEETVRATAVEHS
jgi:hypothetical protein